MRWEALLAVAVAAALLAPLAAQQQAPPAPPPRTQEQPAPGPRFQFLHAWGGFRVLAPELGLELRGEKVLILLDLETVHRALVQGDDGPPRRELDLPAPRRRLSNDLIRARLERSAQAFGATAAAPIGDLDDRYLEALRYVYCENGVVVVRNGVEVLRCDRLWLSPLDDRIVVENAELRYVTPGRADSTLVVRGPKLIKQGGRWTGRDVVLTSCTAAEPHGGIGIDDLEIVERGDEFEIIARGQTLLLGGTAILPLPNASFFTKSPAPFRPSPPRPARASALYSLSISFLLLRMNRSLRNRACWLTTDRSKTSKFSRIGERTHRSAATPPANRTAAQKILRSRVKGRAFGSPLARGLYPRASTAGADPRAEPGAPAAVESRASMAYSSPGSERAGGPLGSASPPPIRQAAWKSTTSASPHRRVEEESNSTF